MAEQAQEVTSASEPQARIAPALSATSDAPKVEAPAAADAPPAEVVEKPVVPPVEGEVTETENGKDGEGTTKEAKPKEELPAYAKREITKARNQKRDSDARAVAAEAKAEAATDRLTKALDALEKVTGDSAVVARKTSEAENPRPKREAFDDPNAYETALVEWAGKVAAAAATASVEAKAETKRKADTDAATAAETEQRNTEVREAFSKRREDFITDHPDYEDIAESDDIVISIPMAAVIMNDEDGPAIAYYLGKNPDEAERISKLSPARVGSELGRIAARINAKPVVQTKPKPITPLRTGANPASTRTDPNDESMDAYAARRNAEMRGKLNGSGASH